MNEEVWYVHKKLDSLGYGLFTLNKDDKESEDGAVVKSGLKPFCEDWIKTEMRLENELLEEKESNKPISWKGLELNDNGDIEGAIPNVFIGMGRVVQKGVDDYFYKQFIKMDIDPKVIEKQLEEISMLKYKVNELEKENTDLKLRLLGAEECTKIREKQLVEAWEKLEKKGIKE